MVCRSHPLALPILLIVGVMLPRVSTGADPTFHETVVPLLKHYCVECHGPDDARGGLNLLKYEDDETIAEDRDRWEMVLIMVEDGEMPPVGKPQPTLEERETITEWVEGMLSQVNCELVEPGRVTLRRLNRAEYNNTIRDLLGIDFQPADDFPADEVGYGFDNIGDVLMLNPLLMEKYLSAAAKISERAIDTQGPNAGPVRVYQRRDLRSAGGSDYSGGRMLASNGDVTIEHNFPEDGQYVLRVRAFGQQAGPDPARMAFKIDGETIEEVDVPNEENEPGTFEVRLPIQAGIRKFAARFTNDYYEPDHDDPKLKGDRNLVVQRLEIQGPGDPINAWNANDLDEEAGGTPYQRTARILSTDGDLNIPKELSDPGLYRVRVRAFGQQAGPDLARLGFKVGGKIVEVVDVAAVEDATGWYETYLQVAEGDPKSLAVSFLNDYYQPDHEDARLRGDRNLVIERIEVAGPLERYEESLPETHKRVLSEVPLAGQREEITRHLLQRLADRAFRRPATSEEIHRLYDLTEMVRVDGGSFEESMQLALQAALVSPHFLFRVEYGESPDPNAPERVEVLGDFELASRLSYFLWSSMPDEELFDLARDGKLQNLAVLGEQVERMLQDPKSKALVENFGGQWLQTRNLYDITPDPERFPDFDEDLRAAMLQETELFFEAIMREDRSILEFLDADFTFVNEPLAKLYGLETIKGNEFQRVDLKPEDNRGGILTQASILTITSNPTRTSPVKRGKWILEQILGTPPPPPPPDVPELEDEGEMLTGTLRDRLEQHREDPNCAVCHNRLDPLGLGFENFNAIGAWRDKEGEFAIDASGTLPSGDEFDGPSALKALLQARDAEFARCLTEKLMTYALGRGLSYQDRCVVDEITATIERDEYSFSSLVREIVGSDPFRKRLVEGSE